MNLSERLKLARGSVGKSQKDMAKAVGASTTGWQNYESGDQVPGGKILEALTRMGFDSNWLLTGEGEMKRGEAGGYVANGHNNILGAHIDAEDVHMTVNQPGAADPGVAYVDPIDGIFLNDWKSLSDIGKMRVWTLLKEEIAKEKEKMER